MTGCPSKSCPSSSSLKDHKGSAMCPPISIQPWVGQNLCHAWRVLVDSEIPCVLNIFELMALE